MTAQGTHNFFKYMRPLSHRIKVSIAQLLCLPAIGWLIGKLTNNTPLSRGFRIYVPPHSGSFVTVASLFWGFYESGERRLIERYLDPSLDVIELGSSLGFISCRIRRMQQSDRRLVLVEANPELIEALRGNLERNRCSLNTEVICAAIAYNTDFVHFKTSGRNTGGHIDKSHTHADTFEVTAVTLGKILESHGIEDYALVCDIEGAEAEIIQYDMKALKRCRQIIIELHSTNLQGQDADVDTLVNEFSKTFTLVHRAGPVCVFEPNT